MKYRYKGLIVGALFGTMMFIAALVSDWSEFVNDTIRLLFVVWLYMALFYGIIFFLIAYIIEFFRTYAKIKQFNKKNSIENYKSK